MPPFNQNSRITGGNDNQFGPPFPQRGRTRAQLEYPLDLESEGALKSALENVQKDVIHRSNRIQTTLLSGATSFNVASSYMVMTAQAAVTIAKIGGGREGQILTLQFGDGNITITDDATGAADTVNLNAPFTSTTNDVLQLLHDGTSWREVSRTVFSSAIKVVYKSADETLNNDTNLQNDDHLLFAVGANEVWAFQVVIFQNSSTVADIKFKWSVPSGTTILWDSQSATGVNSNDETTTEVENGQGANVLNTYVGTVFASSTAGNVVLQWAQNTLEATNTKVLKGSHIIVHRLA